MPEHMALKDFPFQKSARGVDGEAPVREGELRVKLTRFRAGDEIPLHRHTDEKHEKFILDGDEGRSSDPHGMQRGIWETLGRFNAARAMLHPTSRMVTVPDRSSVGRRIRLLKDQAFARMK